VETGRVWAKNRIFAAQKSGFPLKKPKFAKGPFLPIWRARSSRSFDPIELIFVQARRNGVSTPHINFQRSPTLQRRGLGPRFWRFWALKALAHEKSRKFRICDFWVLAFKFDENALWAF